MQHLLRPVVVLCSRAPRGPAWFQRRVWEEFLHTSPKNRVSRIPWMITLSPLVLVWIIPHLRTVSYLAVPWVAVIVSCFLGPSLCEVGRLLASGSVQYTAVYRHTLAGLTGHERLAVLDHVQARS